MRQLSQKFLEHKNNPIDMKLLIELSWIQILYEIVSMLVLETENSIALDLPY